MPSFTRSSTFSVLCLLSGVSAASATAHTEHAELTRRDQPISPGFNYGQTPIRGVNLGGWLVTEPWITPSIYNTGNPSIVDEWTLCQYIGQSAAKARLQKHWATWITETDLATIKAYGLNHVRIAIGYWAFDIQKGEPYVSGQLLYLRNAAGWAKKHGLKVLIDLHGAPGSQNGFDNSGRRGDANWTKSVTNLSRTRSVLKALVAEFSKSQYAGTVTSIEALNEPMGWVPGALDPIKSYYKGKTPEYGYQIVRHPQGQSTQTNLLYSISDAFQPLSTFDSMFPWPQYQGVALDPHIYTVFTNPEVALSMQERIQAYCGKAGTLKASKMWTFVGEWTLARTDCALRLNGQGRGARYDGSFAQDGGSSWVGSCAGLSGTGSSFTAAYKQDLRKLWEVQTQVYESASLGWVMWTWKTEAAADWDYQRGVQGGWIPKDPSKRIYGDQCA